MPIKRCRSMATRIVPIASTSMNLQRERLSASWCICSDDKMTTCYK